MTPYAGVSGFGGANIDALASARQYVNQGKRTKDGVRCPCCEQFCKVYVRLITSTMARWLIELVRRHARHSRWYSASEDWSVAITRGSGDFAKLRWWGLIEEGTGDDEGRWKPTIDGIDFAYNRSVVTSHVLLYNDSLQGFQGDEIGIEVALGNKFSYAELWAEAF